MSILITMVIGFVVIVSVIRVLYRGGVRISLGKKVDSYLSYETDQYSHEVELEFFDKNKKEWIYIVGAAFLFRILIFVLSFIPICLFQENASVWDWNLLLDMWKKWDAAGYQRIAEGGYNFYIEKSV